MLPQPRDSVINASGIPSLRPTAQDVDAMVKHTPPDETEERVGGRRIDTFDMMLSV